MSDNIIVGIFAGLFGIALEATRQWFTRGNTKEEKVTDDVAAFRKELLDENHHLREQRDEWQQKYYDERDARVKAEWQLEAIEWIKEDRRSYLLSDNDEETTKEESDNAKTG